MAVETMDYLDMLERMIRAGGRRVGDADEVELARLCEMRDALEQAIQAAVDGQRQGPRQASWASIAAGTGTTRQGAFQRYGRGRGE